MITLLHGDNIEASRTALVHLKQESKRDIRQVEYKDDALFLQALEPTSLFGGDTVVVLENIFSKLGRKQKKIEEICTTIKNAAVDVIIWEPKEVSATMQKKLGKITIQLFKTPVIIFQFLDSLSPINQKTSLTLLQKLLENEVPEIIFTMLVKRIRQLILLKDKVTPQAVSEWQITRLTAQAQLFSMDQLLTMHKNLLQMEIAIKTGASPFPMSQLLEQYILHL